MVRFVKFCDVSIQSDDYPSVHEDFAFDPLLQWKFKHAKQKKQQQLHVIS